jgi:enolase
MLITKIIGREIYDSRGLPTLECELVLDHKVTIHAQVPSGTSCSSHEAKPLYDGGTRVMGLGVTKAIEKLETIIAPEFINKEPNLIDMDLRMIAMDGTEDKSNLGANTILAASIALAKAQAVSLDMQPYEFIARLCNFDSVIIPYTMFNVINGGLHAQSNMIIQEIMLVPTGFSSCRVACQAVCEINQKLKELIQRHGHKPCRGYEGGYALDISHEQEAFDLLMEAIQQAGYKPKDQFTLALDVAASHLYCAETQLYTWSNNTHISSQELIERYAQLTQAYPIYSIEDGIAENDIDGWIAIQKQLGDTLQIVGDDIFASNPARIAMGIENQLANAAIIKPNQIGTVSESLQAILLCKNHGMNTIISHRSGETEDTFIVDLAIGSNAGQLKAGGFTQGERIAKYNQVLRIEDILTSSLMERYK